jgi:hypothetical protein
MWMGLDWEEEDTLTVVSLLRFLCPLFSSFLFLLRSF